MTKKFICIIFAILIVFGTLVIPASAYKPSTFSITAEGCVLASADTGSILFEKNMDKRLYPASLTTIMTAVVVLDECENPKEVIIPAGKAELNMVLGTDSSVLGIVEGEEFSALDLLYILVVHSGNDAAHVLAKHFGGSVDGFVAKMNQKAAELGMTGSHFTNPYGLHDAEHYTTAKDIYLLTMHALKNEIFKEIFGTRRYYLAATNKTDRQRILATKAFILDPNSMMPNTYYSAVKGAKTGFTDESGRCLVSVAEKKGASYLCVILNCPSVNDAGQKVRNEFSEAKALYQWIFNDFEYRKIYDTQTPVGECPVELAMDTDHVALVLQHDINAVIPKDADQSTIQVEVSLDKATVKAPIKQGQVLGTATVKYAGETLDTAPVVAMTSVERSSMLAFVNGVTSIFTSKYMIAVIIILAVIIIGVIIYIYLLNRRRKNRHRRRVRIK